MLTERELEVLKLRKKGLKQNEIAKKLKLTQPAVSDFEKNAKKKIEDAKKILEVEKEI